MKKINIGIIFIALFLFNSCATYDAKYSGEQSNIKSVSDKKIEKTFFLIGDAGGSKIGETSDALKALKKHTSTLNTKGDYTIFLGDNIYPSGMPEKNSESRDLAEHRLDVQIEAIKEFDGKTIFIPGNHDWYNNGLKGLKREEEYIEKALKDKKAFQPEKGCPIEKIDVSDNVVILALDTQWYITDWDTHPTINDNCEIKSRNAFILEIEGELKKNGTKTILIAMHHPAYTNGSHGGYFNARNHLFPFGPYIPLPGIGSLAVQIRSQGGVSSQDRFNYRYNDLMQRLVTLSKNNERVVFVSGHEHSLQYIDHDGVKQIVSGSGSKKTATALGNDGKFSFGGQGFAVLNVFDDGSSEVRYFSADNGEPTLIYETLVFETPEPYDLSKLPTKFNTSKKVSAYKKEDTEKGKSYRWFWGDHYRDIYGTGLEVPVVTLDTLMGGFTIDRKGGGHQSRALRLLDKDGKNFALRGVKKSAVRFLQSVVFTDNYIEEDFKETTTEDVILDFYTSSHPYATLTIGDLSDAIGVYHTNPALIYVPKHKDLGKYNEEFGDELYIIEERPDDDFINVKSFGKPDAIESTSDVLKRLRKDEKYQIDEAAYIKARLFDMLIGDWDRHQDQWRWSRFDISDDKKIYRPIPRDRDQAFSNYDGALLDIMKVLMPPVKQFQEFSGELKNIEWINSAGIKMDRNFTQNSTKEVWLEQAKFIQQNLTDVVIDEAFNKLPKEVRNETSEGIKEKLKMRRETMEDIASRYYDYLTKLVIITGTDKDDHFDITRLDGKTKISVSRIKGGKILPPYKERTLSSKETKEVWIYGLDDDDRFSVKGKGKKPIFTRIVGGQNNDVYDIEDGRSVKVFEHNSKQNTVVKKGGAIFRFKDIYSNNTYDFDKYIQRINTILPMIGYNADDGMRIKISDTYMVKGFKKFPYHRKHIFRFGYYFATQGFSLQYDGEFANTFGKWNVIAGARFASESFTQNFFGFGNDTENMDETLDFDFNRVKTGMVSGKIGVAKTGYIGSRLALTVGIEKVEVEETPGRFISNEFAGMPEVFDNKVFGNIEGVYSYSSSDNGAFPTRGMGFSLKSGIKTNLDETSRTFGYIIPSLQFVNSISKNRKLVLHTKAQGHFNIGKSFEFFQAANLGADTGLRGFRTERFSGESALAFGADLRYNLLRFKTGLLPFKLGVFGGGDFGRVWVDGENSNTWHKDFGAGVLISAVDAISGQVSFFRSDEGMRIDFGFGLSL
jgi:predicted MPP superfamily phosphohydrolase